MQKVNKTLTFGLEKRIKERKNTYGGSPNANLDQNGSGMKQWFQLRALRSDCVGFEQNGGVFIGKVEPLGSFYRISCHDLVRTCVTMLDSLNMALGLSLGEKAIGPFAI